MQVSTMQYFYDLICLGFRKKTRPGLIPKALNLDANLGRAKFVCVDACCCCAFEGLLEGTRSQAALRYHVTE